MITRTLTLFLIATIEAKITINIKTSSNKNYVSVNYTGFDNKVVSDRDVNIFNITTLNLNAGLRWELGRVPDGVFLKDPTPYSNLYEEYHWPQVNRQMFINNTKILEVHNEEVVLNTHEYVNNTTDVVKVNKVLFENVECTSISSWAKDGYPEDDIVSNVIINLVGKQLRYKHTWRESDPKNISFYFGMAVKGLTDIKPGMSVISKLKANKTIILIEINYVAKLIGNIIADYENLYGKYHFYAPTVANIMKAANLTNGIVTKERIEVRCFLDPQLEMFDKESGMKIELYKPIRVIHKGKKKPSTS